LICSPRARTRPRCGSLWKSDMEVIDTNTTFDSPLFHSLARDAVDRCDGRGDFEAITAIIMSCSAFEAFMNELAQYACTESKRDGSNAIVTTLGVSLLMAIDEWKSPLGKYDLAWEIIQGRAIDKGSGSRQKLKTLFDLRNGLVHTKAEETSLIIDPSKKEPFDGQGEWLGQIVELYGIPKYVKALQSDKLVPKEPERLRWTSRICNRQVAEWAFTLVAKSTEELIDGDFLPVAFKSRLQEQSLAGYVWRNTHYVR
jgi:hypothetical protein